MTDEVPNKGTFFLHSRLQSDDVFDPSQPEALYYTWDPSKQTWELVSVGFTLRTTHAGNEHPDGFVGSLDHWRIMYSLCYGGRIKTRSSSREACVLPSNYVESYGWNINVHVWVDNPLGVFSMWNPNIAPVVPPSSIAVTRTLGYPREGDTSLIIDSQGFSQKETKIEAGHTVSWTNQDTEPHTVTVGTDDMAENGFDSVPIDPGQSFAVKFHQPGEYRYTSTLE